MKRIVLLLGLLACGTPATAQTPALSFDPIAADNLALLYVQFSPEEFAACLEGELDGETYRITDFRMPPQERVSILVGQMAQTGLRVKDGICGERYGSRITLHSHPRTDRDDQCYAPNQDIATSLNRTQDEWLAIICVRGILYWHRSQLTSGEPAYPIAGQVVPFPKRWRGRSP